LKSSLLEYVSLKWINRDGKLIIVIRGLCTFAQSTIAVLLAIYLEKLGFNLTQIGVFLSAGVAGSAFFAFVVSFIADRVGRKRLLIIFTLLSAGTGIALIFIDDFLLLLVFAFIGSLTGRGAMGPVGPLEQASLAETTSSEKRSGCAARNALAGLILFRGGSYSDGAGRLGRDL